MAYYLQAIFVTSDLPSTHVVPGSRIVPLDAGISMLPIGDEALTALGLNRHDLFLERGAPIPGALLELCSSLSRGRRVVYAEAAFAGGPPGFQGYLLFESGSPSGPPCTSEEYGPLSEGLKCLGVTRGNYVDEFERVGLGQNRNTNDWLQESSWSVGQPRRPGRPLSASNARIIELLNARDGVDSHVLLTDGRVLCVRDIVWNAAPSDGDGSGIEQVHIIANSREGQDQPQRVEVFSTSEVLSVLDPQSGETLVEAPPSNNSPKR
jgi:hypothetical protein